VHSDLVDRRESKNSRQAFFLKVKSLGIMKISTTNMSEKPGREFRRRSRDVGVFPSTESRVRLATCYLMEYAEDWGATGVTSRNRKSR
jgi:transposase-like protein